MVDLVLLVEIIGCTLWLSTTSADFASLCAGGAIASSYVAARLSSWVEVHLTPPTSPVFLWTQEHVRSHGLVIAVLSDFLPSIPVSGGATSAHEIAVHLLHVMFFVLMTLGILAVFVVAWFVADALWDRPAPLSPGVGQQWPALLLAIGCGLYLAVLTAIAVGNLSWLQPASAIATAAGQSLGVHWVGQLVKLADRLS